MLWFMLRREYISTPSRCSGVSGCLKDGRCLSCAPVQSGEGGSLWLHAEAIEGHRQHLVVANEHAQLDDLTFVESGHELSPSGMGNNLACMQFVGGGEQQALPSGQILLLGPVRNTGDGGGAKTRLAGEGLCCTHSYCEEQLQAVRSTTSSTSARGSWVRSSMVPAKGSQDRKRRRWRPSVVKTCGRSPIVEWPTTHETTRAKGPSSLSGAGAIRTSMFTHA